MTLQKNYNNFGGLAAPYHTISVMKINEVCICAHNICKDCKTTDSSIVKPHFNTKTRGDWPSDPDN